MGSHSSAGGGAGTVAELAEAAAGGGARRGRRSEYHPRIINMLCQAIRQLGLSDSAAAEQLGMSTTTLSRWKQVHPEIVLQLQQARQEIRMLHLQKIMESASAENGKGWRASAWILERLYPEDYARKISDRFEALNLIEFRKDKERRAVVDEDRKESEKAQAAAQAARAAAAAEAAVAAEAAATQAEAAAGVRSFGGPPIASDDSRRDAEAPDPEAVSTASSIYSETHSHNSRNSGDVELPDGGSAMECRVQSFGVSPTAADHFRRNAGAQNPGAVSVASCIYSERDSRNSRNSAEVERALESAVPHHSQQGAAVQGLAPQPEPAGDSCTYAESASHNSRNSAPGVKPS